MRGLEEYEGLVFGLDEEDLEMCIVADSLQELFSKAVNFRLRARRYQGTALQTTLSELVPERGSFFCI